MMSAFLIGNSTFTIDGRTITEQLSGRSDRFYMIKKKVTRQFGQSLSAAISSLGVQLKQINKKSDLMTTLKYIFCIWMDDDIYYCNTLGGVERSTRSPKREGGW